MIEVKAKKILLIEDDTALNFIIKDNLEDAGFDVVAVEDGKLALQKLSSIEFDLCISDVMLPKLDGFSLAREIRKTSKDIPILFLTAKNLSEDKIEGFKSGGDDYITKPFSMEELLLRIQVFLKRSVKNTEELSLELCSIGSFIFSYEALYLERKESRNSLTYKEAELLLYFCRNANKVMSRYEILRQVWGSDDYYLGRSLDVFISRLRRYFKDDSKIKIMNLHGVGFRFIADVRNISKADVS